MTRCFGHPVVLAACAFLLCMPLGGVQSRGLSIPEELRLKYQQLIAREAVEKKLAEEKAAKTTAKMVKRATTPAPGVHLLHPDELERLRRPSPHVELGATGATDPLFHQAQHGLVRMHQTRFTETEEERQSARYSTEENRAALNENDSLLENPADTTKPFLLIAKWPNDLGASGRAMMSLFQLASQIGLRIVEPMVGMGAPGFHGIPTSDIDKPMANVYDLAKLRECFPELEMVPFNNFVKEMKAANGPETPVDMAAVSMVYGGDLSLRRDLDDAGGIAAVDVFPELHEATLQRTVHEAQAHGRIGFAVSRRYVLDAWAPVCSIKGRTGLVNGNCGNLLFQRLLANKKVILMLTWIGIQQGENFLGAHPDFLRPGPPCCRNVEGSPHAKGVNTLLGAQLERLTATCLRFTPALYDTAKRFADPSSGYTALQIEVQSLSTEISQVAPSPRNVQPQITHCFNAIQSPKTEELTRKFNWDLHPGSRTPGHSKKDPNPLFLVSDMVGGSIDLLSLDPTTLRAWNALMKSLVPVTMRDVSVPLDLVSTAVTELLVLAQAKTYVRFVGEDAGGVDDEPDEMPPFVAWVEELRKIAKLTPGHNGAAAILPCAPSFAKNSVFLLSLVKPPPPLPAAANAKSSHANEEHGKSGHGHDSKGKEEEEEEEEEKKKGSHSSHGKVEDKSKSSSKSTSSSSSKSEHSKPQLTDRQKLRDAIRELKKESTKKNEKLIESLKSGGGDNDDEDR